MFKKHLLIKKQKINKLDSIGDELHTNVDTLAFFENHNDFTDSPALLARKFLNEFPIFSKKTADKFVESYYSHWKKDLIINDIVLKSTKFKGCWKWAPNGENNYPIIEVLGYNPSAILRVKEDIIISYHNCDDPYFALQGLFQKVANTDEPSVIAFRNEYLK